MLARIQQMTQWIGGPWALLLILLVQIALAALLFVDPRIPLALVLAFVTVVVVLDQPILGVGMLIVARLLSTGATVFFRVGHIGVGPFEPALLLCLIGLVFYAALHGRRLWIEWPWKLPYLALMGWLVVSLAWSVDRSDGVSELLPMILVVANVSVILAFVRTWEDFRLMLWVWVGGAVLVGVLAVLTDAMGISTGDVTFQAAAGGGRETGLGQQPNWFAMNLMFIIHTAFGMALVERRRWVRLALVGSAFFILVMMLKSGSRGGAYATLIGGVLAALAHPLFRRWFVRMAGVVGGIFAIGILFNFGDSAKALMRIGSSVTLNQNYRQLNWQVCAQMFVDTWGRGIGAGGYEKLLLHYNNYVAQSLYDYPHGIFWQVIAHYGVVGLIIVGMLVLAVYRMARDLVVMSRGTQAEVFAWTMPAAMLGYVAWSFVEFTLNDKPFWEFLGLYTALYYIVRRAHDAGETLPPWQARLPRLWSKKT